MSEAGLYTARGIGELGQMITNLAEQGFRIITVIDTQNGDYHVVAQKEITYETRLSEDVISDKFKCWKCGEKLVMKFLH